MTTIAYFVSSHGFGHATRSSAVMAALESLDPSIHFEIFTLIPPWLFAESLGEPFGYQALKTDVGVAQQTSFAEDLPETVRWLDEFIPFPPSQIDQLASQIQQLNCQLVICDIAPLGIAIAQAAGRPAILIENFTWDWIYEGYLHLEPRLTPHIAYFRELFAAADYRIQTEPLCQPLPKVDLISRPVSRKVVMDAATVRHKLHIPISAKVVMITMGGIPWQAGYQDLITAATKENRLPDDIYFLIAGHDSVQRFDRILMLGRSTEIRHPDLINASDVVIGKAGYSTIAEIYQAGRPFGYIPRQHFRESPFLVDFIVREMQGMAIEESQFRNGSWLGMLPDLLAMPHYHREATNGADEIARFVQTLLS